jgi:hypothetical protein
MTSDPGTPLEALLTAAAGLDDPPPDGLVEAVLNAETAVVDHGAEASTVRRLLRSLIEHAAGEEA